MGDFYASRLRDLTDRQSLYLAAAARLDDDDRTSRAIDGLPTAAGPETPSVPVGLWRALVERDRGCIAVNCDAPPAWCDVMHLAGDRAKGGRLSITEAGLGCRSHHRKLDLGNWQLTWANGRPSLHPPAPGPALDALLRRTRPNWLQLIELTPEAGCAILE